MRIKSLSAAVADNLIGEIANGRLGVGQKLPPLRHLARDYQISYVTAQKAMKILQDRQIVSSRSGDGSYVIRDGAGESGVVASLSQSDSGAGSESESGRRKIGAILPGWSKNAGGASIYEIINGFTQVCASHEWDVELLNSLPEPVDAARLLKTILNRKFQALVWFTPNAPQKGILEILSDHIEHVIVTERPFSDLRIQSVFPDYDRLCRDMVALFQSRGHRRLLMFTGSSFTFWQDPYTMTILEAMRRACCDAGMVFDDDSSCQIHPLPLREAGDIIEGQLSRRGDADAFICLHNEYLASLVRAIKRHKGDPGNDDLTLIDLCYQSNPFYSGVLDGIGVYRVRRPNFQTGIAIGRYLENAWLGEEADIPELRAEIIAPGNAVTE